jgi:hypothetical protein
MLLRLNIRSELRMFPVSLQTRRPLVLGLCWIKPCGHELLGPTDSESGLRLAGFSFIQGDLIPVSWFGDSRSTYRCPTYLSKRVPWTFTKHFCPFNVKILGLVIFFDADVHVPAIHIGDRKPGVMSSRSQSGVWCAEIGVSGSGSTRIPTVGIQLTSFHFLGVFEQLVGHCRYRLFTLFHDEN